MNSAALANKPANVNGLPTVSKVEGVVRYRNLKGRDSKRFGRVYQGHVNVGKHADVTPKAKIVLFGMNSNRFDGARAYRKTFAIGDQAVYGSYNFTYTGKIVAIGEKTITIVDGSETHKLSICDFSQRNYDFDAERIAAHNADVFMHI